jgi:hypothetical protein
VPQQFELPIIKQVLNILAPAGKKIVEANYLMAIGEQSLTEMRSNKTRATRNYDSHAVMIRPDSRLNFTKKF